MTLHAALATAATLVALAFALSTLERWTRGHKRHELMWTISLFMFALGSLGLWAGAALGWGEWTFKTFYLFGAILNVPFLALGTVYLLADRRTGDIATAVVSLLAAFAAGIVVAAPVLAAFDPAVLPQGSAVFGVGPRVAAAVFSGVASIVIIGGAGWSAVRLWRGRHVPRPGSGLAPGRLAMANVLIAVGTLVLGSGGALNSLADAMNAFAISLVVGISLIFAGFLLTNTPAPVAVVEPWHLPPTVGRQDRETGGETDADAPDLAHDGAPPDQSGMIDLSSTWPGSPSLN